MEAAALIKKLGLQPRRTIRVVAFTNEENGNRGGAAYREWAGASVLIDSKFKGVLGGDSRFQLPSGDHRVTLSRECVDPVTANVFVPEGDKRIWSPPAPVLHPASSH